MAQVLRHLPVIHDPKVLVGYSTSDDAAVYQLTDDLALVQTVDFFPPIVDDPYSYGAIAAANAVSDIYAMGGRPITALNIVCFPEEGLPHAVLHEILRGGMDKAQEAGFVIIGGHTIKDQEPKYGLAVTGLIHPKDRVTNAGARAGDVLVLTKPLGLGVISTGIKQRKVSEATAQRAIQVMSSLNKAAAEAMLEVGVNACTDVTGYGFLGHLREMAHASGLEASVTLSHVPILEEAWSLAAQGVVPGGTWANRRFLEEMVTWAPDISEEAKTLLCDAQTSGGLILAVSPEKSQQLLVALRQRGVEAEQVGEMVFGEPGRLRVSP